MKLNETGFLAKYYGNFYNTLNKPNNLCAYFWKLLIALICYPFIFPIFHLNNLMYPIYEKDEKNPYNKCNRSPIALGIFINIMFGMVGMLVNNLYFGDIAHHMGVFKTYCNGFLTITLIVIVVVGIFKLIKLIPTTPKPELTYDEEVIKYQEKNLKRYERKMKWQQSFIYLTWEFIKAKKNDYCPRIEWISKKK